MKFWGPRLRFHVHDGLWSSSFSKPSGIRTPSIVPRSRPPPMPMCVSPYVPLSRFPSDLPKIELHSTQKCVSVAFVEEWLPRREQTEGILKCNKSDFKYSISALSFSDYLKVYSFGISVSITLLYEIVVT